MQLLVTRLRTLINWSELYMGFCVQYTRSSFCPNFKWQNAAFWWLIELFFCVHLYMFLWRVYKGRGGGIMAGNFVVRWSMLCSTASWSNRSLGRVQCHLYHCMYKMCTEHCFSHTKTFVPPESPSVRLYVCHLRQPSKCQIFSLSLFALSGSQVDPYVLSAVVS
jgi:hypothetical protein